MASSSALVIPLSLFLIGTRLWALGQAPRLHHARCSCSATAGSARHIGTVIFAVQAVLLVPYIIIGVMGGGTTLPGGQRRAACPTGWAARIVALVVMSYVFFGGMRGTAWVNTFQTMLFLVLRRDRASA